MCFWAILFVCHFGVRSFQGVVLLPCHGVVINELCYIKLDMNPEAPDDPWTKDPKNHRGMSHMYLGHPLILLIYIGGQTRSQDWIDQYEFAQTFGTYLQYQELI